MAIGDTKTRSVPPTPILPRKREREQTVSVEKKQP